MTNILYPRNPARILTTAFKMAMSITLALARDRATGKAKPLYFGQGNRIKGMVKIWNRAKQEYQRTVEEIALMPQNYLRQKTISEETSHVFS